MVLSPALLAAVPPLVPDGDEARDWAERELSDPVYRIAEPTFFDRAARAVGEFIANLFSAQAPGEWGGPLAVVAILLVVGVVVAAFLVWGMPRSTRRGAPPARLLFGEDEGHSADELRREAASHASREEWDAAVVLRFRALARGAAERGVVDTPPGATVHAFAREAARSFPGQGVALASAAAAFDDVRYLRRPGTRDVYALVSRADDAVAAARPATEPVGAPA